VLKSLPVPLAMTGSSVAVKSPARFQSLPP
jgi:hypothetical protein